MRTNNFDDDDLRAFVLNESRISTDDRDVDEFDPSEILDLETDANGQCFSDADPGL